MRRSLVRRARRRAASLPGRRRRRVGAHDESLRWLFVITYGRSGSTLLQGILNAIPGYLIRGENRQLLRHLWRYDVEGREEREFQRGLRLRHRRLATGPTDSFFGIDGFPGEDTHRSLRRLVVDTLLRPAPDTRVAGFKEIRWEEDDVADYVAWLCEVFPGARFVLNTRDLDHVARSKWWAERPDAREHLAAVEARLLALADDLGPAAYRVHYDDYVADPDRLRGMFDWLGAPWDPDAVRRALAVRHSY